ncbi:MAG: CAP domain-containing protein [Candidatus Shapirobacteria bacterium]|nr:CAP domain-containing protein [Candidatus Shapirobacteria bacterium]
MKKKIRKIQRLFVPSSANNYRAQLLHLPSLVAIVFVFLMIQSGLSLVRFAQPAVLGYSSQISPEKIVELTNQERASLGLEKLKINDHLNEAARRKAADMFALNYWSHNSPTGREPWSFFKEVGYDYLYAGENLARDFFSPEGVVSAWMNSPTHKENLINSRYQEIGVAVVEGELEGLQTTLVVQLFGTPVKTIAQQEPAIQEVIPGEQIYALTEESQLEKGVLPKLESASLYQNRSEPVSPLTITKMAAIFVLGLLIGVLLVDRSIASKKNISRLVGDNWAHISFLVVILVAVLLFRSGSLLESIASL